jgi:hypothetical protein
MRGQRKEMNLSSGWLNRSLQRNHRSRLSRELLKPEHQREARFRYLIDGKVDLDRLNESQRALEEMIQKKQEELQEIREIKDQLSAKEKARGLRRQQTIRDLQGGKK